MHLADPRSVGKSNDKDDGDVMMTSTSIDIYFRHSYLKLPLQASMSCIGYYIKQQIIVHLTKLELRGNDGRMAWATYWFNGEGKGRLESKSHTWRTLPSTFLCEFKNESQETTFKRYVNDVNPTLTTWLFLLRILNWFQPHLNANHMIVPYIQPIDSLASLLMPQCCLQLDTRGLISLLWSLFN